jgi:hypothetical protein
VKQWIIIIKNIPILNHSYMLKNKIARKNVNTNVNVIRNIIEVLGRSKLSYFIITL